MTSLSEQLRTLPPQPAMAYCVAWYATRAERDNAARSHPTDVGIYSERTPTSCPPRHCWPRVLYSYPGRDFQTAHDNLLAALTICAPWVFKYPSMKREAQP